jgi:hypothetical protein
MANVYSTQFMATTLAFGFSEIYTVPAGFVAVVRAVAGVIFSDISGVATFAADWDGNEFYAEYVPTYFRGPLDYQGWAVGGPGATLTCTAAGGSGGSELVVSGHLLTLP